MTFNSFPIYFRQSLGEIPDKAFQRTGHLRHAALKESLGKRAKLNEKPRLAKIPAYASVAGICVV
ncbi:MAG: hypothetical protein R3B47_09615 [Bacteroidia bacterium]